MCKGLYKHIEINHKKFRADKCLSDIIIALNKGGIETVAHCCGHYEHWGNIVLSDGRELIIAPSFECGRAFDLVQRGF